MRRVFILACAVLVLGAFGLGAAFAAGAQVFDVYDTTQDGLQVGIDADIGNVQAVANPGNQSRVIVEIHVQKAVPNCTMNVELVTSFAATNGGLDATGHFGAIDVLGTLTTNGVGNDNAHFDFDPSTLVGVVGMTGDATPGLLDTTAYSHFDLEDTAGQDCGLSFNQYGAAPDPALGTPFNFQL